MAAGWHQCIRSIVTWLLDTSCNHHLNSPVRFYYFTESRCSSHIGSHALQLYLPLLTKNNTSHKLLKIGCWVSQIWNLKKSTGQWMILNGQTFVTLQVNTQTVDILLFTNREHPPIRLGLYTHSTCKALVRDSKPGSREMQERNHWTNLKIW